MSVCEVTQPKTDLRCNWLNEFRCQWAHKQTTIPQEQFPLVLRRCKYVRMPLLGTEKLYGQLDLGDATYSFDGVRADAEVAHLRKGDIGAKRARHSGGGGDALAVHPIKEEEDEITANDDDGGVNSNNGTMLETAALIQRRRRQRRRRGRRQKADGDRGEGGIYVANRRSGHTIFDALK